MPCRAWPFRTIYFSGIGGLIWSRRSTGNFLGNTDDLVFVHNQLAKRPLPKCGPIGPKSTSRSTAAKSSVA